MRFDLAAEIEEEEEEEIVLAVPVKKGKYTAKITVYDPHGNVVDVKIVDKEEEISRILADRRLFDN